MLGVRVAALVGTLSLATGVLARRASTRASPVQKVIELLEANRVKIVKDLHDEEKDMAEYAQFCDSEAAAKGYSIGQAALEIEDMTAQIEDGSSAAAVMEDDIAKLGTAMSQKEKDLEAAEALREDGRKEFIANEKELEETLSELERAVIEVRRGQGEGLVQLRSGAKRDPKPKDKSQSMKLAITVLSRIVDASWVNEATKRTILGQLQTRTSDGAAAEASEDDDLEMPTPKPFESQTGGMVKMLEDLKEKAEEALRDCRKEETNAEHAHRMMAQSLTDRLQADKDKVEKTKGNLATQMDAVGRAKGEMVETKKDKKTDEHYLENLKHECTQTAKEWAVRQRDAQNEMTALSTAKDVLQGGAQVLAQKGDGIDLELSQDDADKLVRTKVVNKLKMIGSQHQTFAMMEMISAASAGPFDKIRGLIEGMIEKLVTEANQDATQKAFCDEETAKSKASEGDKNTKLDKLRSRIDSSVTSKAKLQEEVKELQAEIAEIDGAVGEATKIRQEEHAEAIKAVADYGGAAEAVNKAIVLLKEYYRGTGFVQEAVGRKGGFSGRQPTFGGAKADSATTILSILDMCGKQFSKMEMELRQSEDEAQVSFEKMTADSQASRAAKEALVRGKDSEIRSLAVAISSHEEDYAVTSQELGAVTAYLGKLKPQCEAKAMSYAEKKASRESEIQGLKEALELLDG